jgi:hypothetical protein
LVCGNNVDYLSILLCRDLGKSDNAEEKHKTENLEGTLADYEKKHEAHERFCIQNMNKVKPPLEFHKLQLL